MSNEPSDADRPLLSVVIPAYNEEATIAQVIARVREQPQDKEIVVVDDCSRDRTREIVESVAGPDLRLLRHERNLGKGAALRTGFGAARGRIVIVQDADCEYDPREYEHVLVPILDGVADVVYGSRFLGGPHRVLFFWHYLGNKFLTLLCNAVSNLNVSDMETGCKAFRREVVDSFKIEENRFGVEPEMTIKVARGGWRVYEVPIAYFGRTYAEGKKIGWRDAVWALVCIGRYGLSVPRKGP
jgi:glycosyltransferase involved in cell wall biosynthesis